jgi:hypothetical protein
VKPDKALEMIESYYPNLPKIELHRRGPARPGWEAWGAEAEDADYKTGSLTEAAANTVIGCLLGYANAERFVLRHRLSIPAAFHRRILRARML